MTMLNDILDFSRIEAGKLELDYQPFSLRELIDDVLAIMAPSAHEKSLELVSFIYEDTPDEVIGDRQRLGQILTNLTSNAIKFTQSGHVAVRAMQDHTDDDGLQTLKFTVTDTGSGLSTEQQAQIFKAFIQADSSRTRQAGGTGLGLAISKTLVEQMQGEIGLDSDPGRGSTFWFTIRARIPKQTLESSGTATHCNKSILLYEQQELSLLSVGHQLQSLGLRVESVSTLTALNQYIARQKPYDLLLFGQGSEVLKETLQLAKPYSASSPVLVMTLTGSSDYYPNQLPTNIKTISKPIARNKLQHCLESLICPKQELSPPINTRKTISKVLNILVVDDHPVNLKLLDTVLSQLHQRVVTASSGHDAIALCQQQSFDLILMDVQMPELDGLQTTAEIRKLNNHYSNIPVIAITAHALPDERRQILQSGINDYMTKPVYTQQLLTAINHWVDQPAANTPTVDTPTADISEHSPINIKESIRLTSNDKALADDLLNMLFDSLPEDLEIIRSSFENRDRKTLLERVHRLHGACQYCAAPALKAACFELENKLKSTDNLENIQIITAVENTVSAINEVLIWSKEHQQ